MQLTPTQLTLAITGGTGFVGRHTLAAALARGHRVRALARRPQPELPGVLWVPGALDDAAALRRLVDGADVVIHIAGVVNAPDAAGFEQGNVLGTAAIRRAAGALPFVHVSSLAAREPRLSIYGDSKYRAEDAARDTAGPVAMVRPPGVYGPGDTELLMVFQGVRMRIAAAPRGRRASMIFAPDLAEALVALAEDLVGEGRSAAGVFEIDDGAGGYAQTDVVRAAAAAMGRRAAILPIPGGALRVGATVDSLLAKWGRRPPKLTHDRARYLAHPDWTADVGPLLACDIWRPATALAPGMAQTVAWYRREGWL